MFAGWNFPKDLTQQADWVKAAYDGGVPMGGDLARASRREGCRPLSSTPSRIPNSGNLDRIQIIKISTKNGKSEEKVVRRRVERRPQARSEDRQGSRRR